MLYFAYEKLAKNISKCQTYPDGLATRDSQTVNSYFTAYNKDRKTTYYLQWPYTHNIGIQLKQKELAKTFMMILNWKNLLVSMVHANIFQRPGLNPLPAKLFYLNFHPLEVVSRWQLQVSENYSDLTKWRSTLFKSCWLMSHFIFIMWYLIC